MWIFILNVYNSDYHSIRIPFDEYRTNGGAIFYMNDSLNKDILRLSSSLLISQIILSIFI